MKRFIILITFFITTRMLHATCSESPQYWQMQMRQSPAIEQFFMQNYRCQRDFYQHLNTAQKIYFDTVIYPGNLTEEQYQNRWLAMSMQDDRAFFKTFTFFNNYFTAHKDSITTKQLECFQAQKGFPRYVPREQFYRELAQRNMSHDVSYLYPLIRWSYANNGIDMSLSAQRVQRAEQLFGIKRGKIGDSEQFARFLALYDAEYDYVANELANQINITPITAYKLLVILTYLESRGNIFAVSNTGAFGPLQSTLHFYMLYGEPNNPFDPKASLAKLANKFVHYYREGRTLDASVIAYKSGSLNKCTNGMGQNSADCQYYYNYKNYMSRMDGVWDKGEISRYMTGNSYFFPELAQLQRLHNPNGLVYYEPYQYAVPKNGLLSDRLQNTIYLSGVVSKSLGKMKRSEIYKLQDRYGVNQIEVISDKSICR